jgi:hypothetical protein
LQVVAEVDKVRVETILAVVVVLEVLYKVLVTTLQVIELILFKLVVVDLVLQAEIKTV